MANSPIDIINKYGIPLDPKEEDEADSLIDQVGVSIDDVLPDVGMEEPESGTTPDDIIAEYGVPLEPDQQPPGQESDISGAVGRGVKTSLNPFGMSAEEFQRSDTTGETVAEVGANIATDILTTIGAATLTGAAVGSAITPGVGTVAGSAVGVGLGIYRALGWENLMSRVDKRDFDWGKAAVNVGAETIPFMRFGGRGLKFLLQGGAQAAQASQYGAEGSHALIAGAVGGALGAAAHRTAAAQAIITADPRHGVKGVDAIYDSLLHENNSLRIRDRAFRIRQERVAEEDLILKVFTGKVDDVKEILDDFGKFAKVHGDLDVSPMGYDGNKIKLFNKQLAKFNKKNPTEKLNKEQAELYGFWNEMRTRMGAEMKEYLGRNGRSIGNKKALRKGILKLRASKYDMREFMDMQMETRATIEAMQAETKKMLRTGEMMKDPTTKTGMFSYFTDPLFVSRGIDDVLGTNLEGISMRVSRGKYTHAAYMFGVTGQMDKLLKQAKKVGIDRRRIVKMIEHENLPADPKQAKVIEDIMQLFDDVKEFGRRNGIDIDNYDAARLAKDSPIEPPRRWMHQQQIGGEELVTTLRREIKDMIKKHKITDDKGRVIKEGILGDTEEAKQLVQALERATGREKRPITDADQLMRALNDLTSGENLKRAAGFEATGAYERKRLMIPALREQDIGKVFMSYTNNISKTVHMNPIIDEMQNNIPILRIAFGKDSRAMKYYENYIQRLSGQTSDKISALNAAKVKWKAGIQKVLDENDLPKYMVGTAKAAKVIPDFMSWTMAQLYPNFLGYNIRAPLRNSVQPFMTTAPEIGGGYGYKLAMRGSMRTLADKTKGLNLEDELVKKGFAPGKYLSESLVIMGDTLRSIPAFGRLVGSVEKLSEVAMYMYQKTDVMNRTTTIHIAKELSNDILEGNKGALTFVKNLSAGAKSDIYRSLQSGKLDDIEKTVTQYLLSKTQFDYGPQAISQFGRDWGRLFSMFTKWPSMVYGDTYELISKKKFGRFAGKYLGPWAVLAAGQQWLDQTKDNPRRRALLGSGLMSYSPLYSLQVSKPPFMEMGAGVADALMQAASGDLDDLANSGVRLGKIIKQLTPLYGLGKGKQMLSGLLLNK